MSKVHNRHDKAFTVTCNGDSRPVLSHPEFGVIPLHEQPDAPKPAPKPTPKKEKEVKEPEKVEAHKEPETK